MLCYLSGFDAYAEWGEEGCFQEFSPAGLDSRAQFEATGGNDLSNC